MSIQKAISYADTKLLIDGEWCDSASGKKIDVLNPATEEVIGTVAHAGTEDLDRALRAAAAGFLKWSATSAYERSKLMRAAASLLRARIDEIAPLLTLEQGKPLAQSVAEITAAADTIEWFAEETRRTYGQTIPSRRIGVTQITLKVPVGPVAAFTPWNFPINQAVRKLSAALATGCSIIVKAPEETPASPAALVRCFEDAGIFAGVIGLVYGIPSEISEYLIPHEVIRKVSFTGSTPVGKQLAALAGAHMKRVTMELGGHAPVMVFDDADIDAAIEQMRVHKFRNAGQVCVSPTRFLVQSGVFDEFTDRFVESAGRIRVGDGTAPQTEMGPLANKRRLPALQSLVSDALDHGGTLAIGGKRIGNHGWFMEPTVLTNVPATARIMNEEPFGPVAIINRHHDEESILHEANRLPFALAAYAYTRSAARQTELQKVNAGMLTINHLGLALPEIPFGGMLDSGYGTEGGSEAVEAYLDTKLVTSFNH